MNRNYIMTMTCVRVELLIGSRGLRCGLRSLPGRIPPCPAGRQAPHMVSLWAFLSWGNLLPGDGEKTPLGRRHLRGALTGQLTSLGAMGWGEGHSKQRDQNVRMRKQKISQNSGPSIFLQKHKNCLFHLGSDKVQKSLWDFFSVTPFKISFILQ